MQKEKEITIDNFFEESYAIWEELEISFLMLHTLKPNYVSKSGSQYYYIKADNEMCIVRISNHWGNVKNCQWYLNLKYNLNYDCITYSKRIIAICKLSDFKPLEENPFKNYEYEFWVDK